MKDASKLDDGQVAERLEQLQNERSTVARSITPEAAAEAAQASVERARQLFGGRTPPFAAVDGQLLDNQLVDVAIQFVLDQPGFVTWLAEQALVGDLSRKAKDAKLAKLDAEIAEIRKEHNARRVTAAKAEAEARIKAEIAGLEQQIAAETA